MTHDRICIDPKVMAGKPVITGTRIPVEKVLRELGNGLSYDDILREYPRLTRDDILAAQRFAADYMQDWIEAGDHTGGPKEGAAAG